MLCFIFIDSLWTTSSPPPVLFFLGTDMDLYPWGHSLSCVRLSSTLIQVFVSAQMSMVFSSIVCWISCVLFWTDLQLINVPLYLNDDLFWIQVLCWMGSDHKMPWSIVLALVTLVDCRLHSGGSPAYDCMNVIEMILSLSWPSVWSWCDLIPRAISSSSLICINKRWKECLRFSIWTDVSHLVCSISYRSCHDNGMTTELLLI